MSAQRDLQLLVNALTSQNECEADGVKFIYMDDNTVYRFENNRMKKVSAALLKKAHKLISTQQAQPQAPASSQELDDDEPEPVKPKRTRKAAKVIPQEPSDNDDEDEPEPVKPKRATRNTRNVPSPNIDLNEYYNTKNRLEFMNVELDRLTNKVNKLKQYKSIVNKITGGEYDIDVNIPQAPSQQAQAQIPQLTPEQYQQYLQFTQQSSHGNANDNLFLY